MEALISSLKRASEIAQKVSDAERADPFFAPKLAWDTIEPALRMSPDLLAKEGKYAVIAARGAASFNLRWQAERFAERIVFGIDPEQIALDFVERLASNSAETIDVWLIFGLEIDRKTYLTENTWVCNSDDLNDLPGLGAFLKKPYYVPEPSDAWIGSRVAICHKYIENNILRPIPEDGCWRTKEYEELGRKNDQIADRIIDILTLIVSGPLLQLRKTSICSQPGSIGTAGLTIQGAGYPTMIPYSQQECIEGNELKWWFDDYCSSPMWSKLQVSVDRLRSSRLHFDKVNRAIDLGISLEAALMRLESSTAEIRNKISTRFAWLVGESAIDRRAAAKRARNLYDGRSSAVHNGILKSDFNADEADLVCKSTLRALIKLGEDPNWDAIVFGS